MIISPVAAAPAHAPVAPVAPTPAPVAPAVLSRAPRSLAGAQALEGVAELGPIIDFPGVTSGQRFTITPDSRAGKLGSVKGNAEILRFDDEGAVFYAKAGKFGFNVEANIDVQRIDAEHVRVRTTTSRYIPGVQADMVGKIVASRTNYAEFVNESDPNQRMVLQRNDEGIITIDTAVPTFGDLHIVLAPKA